MDSQTQLNPFDHEVVVIGGGAAGLAAATALARSRRDVLVIDAGEPRNAVAEGAHNVLGQEGIPPTELLARGREQLAAYGAQVCTGRVVEARHAASGFEVDLADGSTVSARRLIVTAGVVDVLPDVPGLSRHWGRDVVHCPYCHGWEVRGRRMAVLVTSPMSVHQALLFSQLTDELTVLAHGTALDEAALAQLASLGVDVVPGRVESVLAEGDRLRGVRLQDGRELPFEAVVVATRVEVRGDFLGSLGVEVTEHPSGMGTYVPVDEMGQTSVAGVYAAGNLTDPGAQVMASAAAGTKAGAVVNMDLIMTDTTARMSA